MPAANVTFIVKGDSNDLWIGTWDDGLIKFNEETKKYQQYKHDQFNSYSISNNSTWDGYIDSNNCLILSTHSGH